MAEAAPYSKDFACSPPTCEPETVTLKMPCKGKDEEMITITIKNPGQDRLTYKVTGNKIDQFRVPDPFGFCDGKSSKGIEIVPKAIKTSNGWNKFDHFMITVAPAAPGDLWEAKDLWKGEHKQSKPFKVNIKTVDEEGE